MSGLRAALENRLGGLPRVTYENGYPVQALPKIELLEILAANPEAGEEDRQWAADVLVAAFHDEFCEYGGTENGVDVCDGECREIAELITGLSPSDEAMS